MDIDAAIGYVVAHGDPVERARLSYLRTGTAPPEHIVQRITDDLTPGGGWPASEGQVPSVDATCYRLRELDDLGGLEGAPVERALGWLVETQRPDGSWQEDAALAAEAPVWAMPGDPEATLYLTATAGFWLAVAQGDSGRFAEPLRAAAGYVNAQIRPDGSWPSFLAAGWHAAGLLHRTQFYYESARTQIVLGDRLEGMSPANVASMAAALRRVDLGDDWLLQSSRKRLAETQRSDGGWDSDEGPVFDVNTTLTVIRAFR